jgi:hypothetical protein
VIHLVAHTGFEHRDHVDRQRGFERVRRESAERHAEESGQRRA